ncbi:hypothetical protein XAC2852_120166 [Xanthomonas citri pv. citri]|nr:hypothetical protein XAC908_150019 [Xanthomonas citri pv. citri]CEE43000.1 hypothetical protein XAC9322_80179 [Xanthomonas citri pv. citri]CEE55974.1 hypothetical protein XAC2852_120166 [Xanthomonas citri pv. citri]CEE75874.1 hypothetical protein XAC3218_120088 [Xanthomonas citri pv. citri]CEH69411.1 hypothetical protein XAC3615_810002 [Xanthomonas citri pv. citri]
MVTAAVVPLRPLAPRAHGRAPDESVHVSQDRRAGAFVANPTTATLAVRVPCLSTPGASHPHLRDG